MNWKFLYNLWQSKKSVSPEVNFKNKLWNRLSLVWDEQYKANSQTSVFVWYKWISVGVSSFLLAGFLGTGVYAYNSSAVTTGTLLYPLKTVLEKVEEKIKQQPKAKAEFYLKTLEKREQEMEAIVAKQQEKKLVNSMNLTEERVEYLEQALENLEDTLVKEEVDSELVKKIQNRLEKRLEIRKKWLEKTQEKLNEKI